MYRAIGRLRAGESYRVAAPLDSVMYPTGSLFSDCQGVALPQLVAMAANVARQSGVAVVNLRCFKVISCTTIVP